jgi:signal transduction histidine kinase
MQLYMAEDAVSLKHVSTSLPSWRRYERRTVWVGTLLFFSYIAVTFLIGRFIPMSDGIIAGDAIALAALFFGGTRLWPIVWAASFVSLLLLGVTGPLLFLSPVASVVACALGAYLLTYYKVDPIFRHRHDAFYVGGIIFLISVIHPTLYLLPTLLNDPQVMLAQWSVMYVGAAFSFLIVTPFLLRWFAKPGFSRNYREIIEIIEVFGILSILTGAFFIGNVSTFFGIPLVYVILAPLFWIALRLRPRFITLALLIVSAIGLVGVGLGYPTALGDGAEHIEFFMIMLAISFLIITAQEEDLRVTNNMMFSQLGTLQNALARVRSESEGRKDFIAVLAHELRNPLAPVVSTIDFLKLKRAHDGQESEALELMTERMKTVGRILDDLLDVSRFLEGKIALNQEIIDLNSALKAAIISTAHYRKEFHQHLVFKAMNEPIWIRADQVRIEQVFSNLLSNASKYSNPGDSIFLSIERKDGFVEIIVADEGVGLPPDALEAIFAPFHQAHEGKRSQLGLGIGLTLVRSFVELHGGRVGAYSEGPGKGSRFVVELPTISHALPAPQSQEASRSLPERTRSELSVLIVDDNDAAAAALGRLLEMQQCSVSYAYDGAQAIEKALVVLPDVVLLDIQLPGEDGYGVATALRERGFKGKIIALSGYGERDFAHKYEDHIFDRYLIKPIGNEDLQKVLQEARDVA